MQPKSIAGMSEITILLPSDGLITRAMHSNCNVVLETSDFITCFSAKGGTHNIKCNIIDEIDITGMVDKSPAWIARYNTATNNCR
ncbi:MAG: hypothetical protein ED554_09420 [Synechococcus sp. YX04-3]|nr:MAG: hypothetical protein ED554_09420 [Synechococcus sp. YX04-3]